MPAAMSFSRALFCLLFCFLDISTAQNNDTNSTTSYRYYTNATAPFFVSEWPLVDFPTGEFYAGNVPINASDPLRSLFFVFKPASQPVNETTIWFNGGPGCSSLTGFLQENGPFTWQPGTLKPVKNPYAWSKVTNMLWVEFPVGAGFTTGNITATDNFDTGEDFVGFYRNWQKIFGIRDYKTYVTGESYAGYYVPYVASAMLDQKDTAFFDVAGALVYAPTVGKVFEVQQNVPTLPFVKAKNVILNLNESFVQDLEALSRECGHLDFFETYLQFPPPGQQPGLNSTNDCDVYNLFLGAWNTVNPCASAYEITQGCPVEYDPLAVYPGYDPQAYFNRPDVRAAIHAPDNFGHDVDFPQLNTFWLQCGVGATSGFIQPEGDTSPDPALAVLPRVIEATERVLLSVGSFDAVIPAQGALLAIQNMTWNNELGFQRAPTDELVVPGQGVMGKWHFERGLMWVESYATGHLAPIQQPRATLRHLEWLVGRIEEF